MNVLVTGVAGFVGSHLAAELLARGERVLGIDSLIPTYDSRQRLANLALLDRHENFDLRIDDMRTVDLLELLDDITVVYHLAAIPGVRASWSSFPAYLDHNVLALQRLLDAARHSSVGRIVWASSSSVYGETDNYPTREGDATRPHSPYGATKLAGEHLAAAYARNYGVDIIGLRYFSVYGPRQRPDMGIHRICEASLGRSVFELYGDGDQVRDMTYVSDVVQATIAAASTRAASGTLINIAGGCRASVKEVIDHIERIGGRKVRTERVQPQAGDVRRTGGDISLARNVLGWEPQIGLEKGLSNQLQWHREKEASEWPKLGS